MKGIYIIENPTKEALKPAGDPPPMGGPAGGPPAGGPPAGGPPAGGPPPMGGPMAATLTLIIAGNGSNALAVDGHHQGFSFGGLQRSAGENGQAEQFRSFGNDPLTLYFLKCFHRNTSFCLYPNYIKDTITSCELQVSFCAVAYQIM